MNCIWYRSIKAIQETAVSYLLGSGSLTSKFKTRIDLESNVGEVFVVKSAPDGTKISQKEPVTSTAVGLIIGESTISGSLSTLAKSFSNLKKAKNSGCC